MSERMIAVQRIKTLARLISNTPDEDEQQRLIDEIEAISNSLSTLYYTDVELCEMLGVSPATTYLWRKKRLINYCQLTTKQFGYLPRHIIDFLEEREIQRDRRRKSA